MSMVLAVSNQKGGVGKTTTVVNLAWYFACAGRKTLTIDCDPQGNASSAIAPTVEGHSVFDGQAPLATPVAGLSLIPGGAVLLEHERALAQRAAGHGRMRELIKPLRATYDPIIIDCPPSLSFLPSNALLAATHLLIPLQCEYYALEGLGQLLAYVDELRMGSHLELEWIGILLTMHDPKNPACVQIERDVRGHFGTQVLRSVIPRDPALAIAPSHGQAIAESAPLAPGSLAYLTAAKEIIDVITA